MPAGRKIAIALASGAVVGGLVGAAFVGAEPRNGEILETPTTASPAPTTTQAPWFDGGAQFRSTIVRVEALVVGDGEAELEFELLPLHWTDGGERGDELPVLPEHWELRTASGQVYEATTPLGTHVARWEVPADLDTDDVSAVHVVGWRLAVPVASSVTLPVARGASARFSDGATLAIETVLEQTNSTIVQLATRRPDDPWSHTTLAAFRVTDPRWRIGSRFGSSSNVQLTWEGDDAPAEVELMQAYPVWRPLDEQVLVLGPDR